MKNNVREIRNALKLTQVEFAKKIGVKQVSVSSYEHGVIMPSFDTCKKIIKLAKAHGISLTIEDVRPD